MNAARWLRAVTEDESLDQACVLVATAMFTFANADGSNCRPSQAALARRARRDSSRTVRRAIARLSDTGYVTVHPYAGTRAGNGQATHLYVLTLPDTGDHEDTGDRETVGQNGTGSRTKPATQSDIAVSDDLPKQPTQTTDPPTGEDGGTDRSYELEVRTKIAEKLNPAQRSALQAESDQDRETFYLKVREAERRGLDSRAVVNGITAKPLDGARSGYRVLASRLDNMIQSSARAPKNQPPVQPAPGTPGMPYCEHQDDDGAYCLRRVSGYIFGEKPMCREHDGVKA